MHKDDGFAVLKFFEDRLQDRVSEVHAVGIRKENEAIQPEDVERVRQLLQGGIDIRQGEAGETSKPVRSCVNEFGREVVAAARQSPRFCAISRVHSGRTERDHRAIVRYSMRVICLPARFANRSTRYSTRTGTSSAPCRSGGTEIGNTFSL